MGNIKFCTVSENNGTPLKFFFKQMDHISKTSLKTKKKNLARNNTNNQGSAFISNYTSTEAENVPGLSPPQRKRDA